MLKRSILVLVCSVTLAACATRQPPPMRFVSVVNAFARPEASAKKSYFITPCKKGPEQLSCEEFSGYVRTLLHGKGFRETPESAAEIHIGLSYGIKQGETHYLDRFGLDRYTDYSRLLSVSAYTHGADREPILWQTTITSTGQNSDLRLVIPHMLIAAAPYLAASAEPEVTEMIRSDDPRVAQLRAGTYPGGTKD